MNTRIVQILLAFLVFFILTNPGAAGPQAREFVGWLGDGIEAVGIFLEGLFSDGSADTPAPSSTSLPPGP
ncbi:MAG: hypothetical protein AAGD35_06420 [Actinomycetota bacterium]